jgi:hypothetical protein
METKKLNVSKLAPVLMAFVVMSFVDLVGIGVDRVTKDMNLSALERLAARAARRGARLVAFPECCITGYEPLAKLSPAELRDVADRCRRTLGTHPPRGRPAAADRHQCRPDRAGARACTRHVKLFPMAGRQLHKFHLFVHRAGRGGTTSRSVPRVEVRHPDLLRQQQPENGRVLATGAWVLLAPHQTATSPSATLDGRSTAAPVPPPPIAMPCGASSRGRAAGMMRWLPSRAYDNGCYLVFSNGVGPDGDQVRTGSAMILDPHGRLMTESRALGDDVVIADLDPSPLAHNLGRSHLQTRRPELYLSLVKGRARRASTKASRDAAIADTGL